MKIRKVDGAPVEEQQNGAWRRLLVRNLPVLLLGTVLLCLVFFLVRSTPQQDLAAQPAIPTPTVRAEYQPGRNTLTIYVVRDESQADEFKLRIRNADRFVESGNNAVILVLSADASLTNRLFLSCGPWETRCGPDTQAATVVDLR